MNIVLFPVSLFGLYIVIKDACWSDWVWLLLGQALVTFGVWRHLLGQRRYCSLCSHRLPVLSLRFLLFSAQLSVATAGPARLPDRGKVVQTRRGDESRDEDTVEVPGPQLNPSDNEERAVLPRLIRRQRRERDAGGGVSRCASCC